MRNTWGLALSGAAVILALLVLSTLRPELGEAVNATGTMIAGVAAAYAARQSATAARDTRLSLALHYQPKGEVSKSHPNTVGEAPEVYLAIVDHHSGTRSGLRDIVVTWTSPAGPGSSPLPEHGRVVLTGAKVLEYDNSTHGPVETDVTSLEVSCFDVATGSRWLGRLNSRWTPVGGRGISFGMPAPFDWSAPTFS